MNKLKILQNMGFKISWKLISIGMFGDGEIPSMLNRSDVLEYLESLLTVVDEQTDNIVSLICEENDFDKFDSILKKLANDDTSDVIVQKRKWRVYLLKDLIDNISKDSLQGLLELMEFWIFSMRNPYDCPQDFPDSKTVKKYFTKESYEFYLNKNLNWIKEETASIIKIEIEENK